MKTVTTDTTRRPLKTTLGKVDRPICVKPLMGATMIVTPVKYPIETVRGEVSNVIIDQRSRTIHGTVTDEKGESVPGASIMIKGTRTGVPADNNGQFRILAKTGNILLVTRPGIETTEAVIGSGDSISIVVKKLIFTGEEIVAIAGMVYVRPVRKELKNVPLMKEILADPSKDLFKVFPNPLPPGSDLNIELKQTEEGYYSLQLLDQSGQSVHQQEIWIDAEARILNIDIPPVAAGSYFLALTNKRSGKRSTEKIIIQ